MKIKDIVLTELRGRINEQYQLGHVDLSSLTAILKEIDKVETDITDVVRALMFAKDDMISPMCKRLNPQHAGCNACTCDEMGEIQELLRKYE